jgi:competence protein ComEC
MVDAASHTDYRRKRIVKRSISGAAVQSTLLLLLAIGSAVAWLLALRSPSRLTITFLDVGQGDAVVIETPQGHTLVVDTGPMRSGDDAGRRAVVPFLRSRGVNRVDALLLTHEDNDHAGGARTVIERLGVAQALGPAGVEHHRTLSAILSAPKYHVPYRDLASGDVLRMDDGVEVDVLRPRRASPDTQWESENDTCLVMRVRYGAFAMLLTGDIGARGEEDLLAARANVNACVLKLGHHGSGASSTEAFLKAVRPRLAIVSVGRRNVYGHPHPAVLARLAALGVTVLRTDRQGTVTVETDGRTVTYRTMR